MPAHGEAVDQRRQLNESGLAFLIQRHCPAP
jgi:hypothetical protein